MADAFFYILAMGFFALFVLALLTTASFAETPKDSAMALPEQAKEDTVYVVVDEGIPWNREHFDPERLIRKETADPALSVAYTYSVNFTGGSFGTFAHQSLMAHLAYEFTPNLHLYANMGIWMPLYSHYKFGTPIAKEDVRQGNVQVVIPDVTLEYRPTDNTSLRLMIVNERDACKAYGHRRYYSGYCSPWRY